MTTPPSSQGPPHCSSTLHLLPRLTHYTPYPSTPNTFPSSPHPLPTLSPHRFLELKAYVLKRRDELTPDDGTLTASQLMGETSKAKGFGA